MNTGYRWPGAEPEPEKITYWQMHWVFRVILVGWTLLLVGSTVWNILTEPDEPFTWVVAVAVVFGVALAWWAATRVRAYHR